ncbi:hypothetical protein PUN4_830110 [Paraburkholderia unamae]|nr:hypothetical protein PUN4_830110 [Paraburkholderia unamae]
MATGASAPVCLGGCSMPIAGALLESGDSSILLQPYATPTPSPPHEALTNPADPACPDSRLDAGRMPWRSALRLRAAAAGGWH